MDLELIYLYYYNIFLQVYVDVFRASDVKRVRGAYAIKSGVKVNLEHMRRFTSFLLLQMKTKTSEKAKPRGWACYMGMEYAVMGACSQINGFCNSTLRFIYISVGKRP